MENNIKIIHEDKNFLVVSKPAGLIVHPTSPTNSGLRGASEGAGLPAIASLQTMQAGKTGPTLVDWLVDKYPEIKKLDWPPLRQGYEGQADSTRPGIVHRLDKDTSGVILLAKNPETLTFFQDQFRNRETQKTYLALCLGKVEPKEGTIKSVIGRDQNNRTKQRSSIFSFSWDKSKTREAETDYKVIQEFDYRLASNVYRLSLLEVKPKTGRMHQIRVHLKQEGWPIIGDQVYNTKESKKISDKLDLLRQFLHAHKLKFQIEEGGLREFKSDLPDDLQSILEKLNGR